jgi:hypothetical protein
MVRKVNFQPFVTLISIFVINLISQRHKTLPPGETHESLEDAAK